MAPKKKTEESEEHIRDALARARQAIEENRPREAVVSLANIDGDVEVVFVLAAAYRALVSAFRKAPSPDISAPPGTQESVNQLQRLHDIHTDFYAAAREAFSFFEDLHKRKLDEISKAKKDAPVVDPNSDLMLLLLLETADFKRYTIDALVLLKLPDDKLKHEVLQHYAAIKERIQSSTCRYIPLRLAINWRIFCDSAESLACAQDVLTKDVPPSPKAKKALEKDSTENRENVRVAAWPVPTDELSRLRKKVSALAN